MRYLPKFTGRVLPRARVRHTSAFTLLEILVAIAIVGMLAALAITNVDKIFGDAQGATTKLFITGVKTPLTAYRIHMGSYPSTAEGLQALIANPGSKPGWSGPYLSDGKLSKDNWGEPYQYAFPGTRNKDSYDIWSKGPDKQSGTADDIGNWEIAPTAEK